MNYDFRKAVLQGTLPHAFIIEGPHNIDKVSVVKSIVKGIFCSEEPGTGCGRCATCRKIENGNYGDIIYIEPDTAKNSKVRSIRDEAVVRLQEDLMKRPVEGDRNIGIISGADSMTLRAFNRLLKTIEEPVPGTVLFLLSENVNIMPQTIRSRCIHVRLQGDEMPEDSQAKQVAEELISLIRDGEYFYRKKQLIEEYADSREKGMMLLDAMEKLYMDILKGAAGEPGRYSREYIFNAVRYIEESRREIQQKMNMNYSLLKMVLNIGG